jgi:hypothetical protein
MLKDTCTYSHDVWEVAFPQEYVGTALVKTASRLMPRDIFTNDTSRANLFAAHKDAIEKVTHPLPSLLSVSSLLLTNDRASLLPAFIFQAPASP